jgi:hypothetical protein
VIVLVNVAITVSLSPLCEVLIVYTVSMISAGGCQARLTCRSNR